MKRMILILITLVFLMNVMFVLSVWAETESRNGVEMMEVTIMKAEYIADEGISIRWTCSNDSCNNYRIEVSSKDGLIICEYAYENGFSSSQDFLLPYEYLCRDILPVEEYRVLVEGIAGENLISDKDMTVIAKGDAAIVFVNEDLKETNYAALDSVPDITDFSVSSIAEVGESYSIAGIVNGNGCTITDVSVAVRNTSNESLGGYWSRESGLCASSYDLSSIRTLNAGEAIGNTKLSAGSYIVQVYVTTQEGRSFEREYISKIIVTEDGRDTFDVQNADTDNVLLGSLAAPILASSSIVNIKVNEHATIDWYGVDGAERYALIVYDKDWKPLRTENGYPLAEIVDANTLMYTYAFETCGTYYILMYAQAGIHDGISSVQSDAVTVTVNVEHDYAVYMDKPVFNSGKYAMPTTEGHTKISVDYEQYCQVCGAKGPNYEGYPINEFGEHWYSNNDYLYNDEEHWLEDVSCNGQCGYNRPDQRAAHTLDADGRCSVCGYVKREESFAIHYRIDSGNDQTLSGSAITISNRKANYLTMWVQRLVNGSAVEWIQPDSNNEYRFVVLAITPSNSASVMEMQTGYQAKINGAGSVWVSLLDSQNNILCGFTVIVEDSATHDVAVSFQYDDKYDITKIPGAIQNKANQFIADAKFMTDAAGTFFNMVGEVLDELSGGDAEKLDEMQHEFVQLYADELNKVTMRQFGIDVHVDIPYFGNVSIGGKKLIEGSVATQKDFLKAWNQFRSVKGPSQEIFERTDGQGFVVDIGNTGSVRIVEVVVDGEKINYRSGNSPYSFRIVGSPYVLSVGAHDEKIIVGNQAGVVVLELLKNEQPISQFTITTANFSDGASNAEEMSKILNYIGTSAPEYVFAYCQFTAVANAYWCMLTKNTTEDNILADEFAKAGFWQDKNGIYHTGTKYCSNCYSFWRGGSQCQQCKSAEYEINTDCWQMNCGYADLYDEVFNIATDMERLKLPFTAGDTEYILWAWKGDYLNLGAGAELGIYEKTPDNQSSFYKINKKIAMPMTLKLYYDGELIIDYDPGANNPQWWITGFNPNSTYYDCNVDKLTAVYTVQFNDPELFDAFYYQWRIAPYLGIRCNTESMVVTITF